MTTSIRAARALAILSAVGASACATPPAAEAPSAGSETSPAAPSGETPAPASDAETPATPADPTPADGTSTASGALRVGERTDGAVLEKLEIAWVGGGAVIDFVFAGSGKPPSTTASLTDDGKRVVVEIHGVREVKASLPLVTGEGGAVIGKPRALAEGPVADIGRYFLGDDSGIRVEMALREPATLEMTEGTKVRSARVVVKKK